MPSSFLTLDLGNSAAKLVLWELAAGEAGVRAAPTARLAAPPAALLAGELACFLADRAAPEGAAISSVSRPALRDALREALGAAVAGAVLVAPEAGLDNACEHPETVGLDRLYAARGALELVGAPALVVDAGTALTVDALDAGSGNGRARFLGGAIAPGPLLLAGALAAGTAALPEVAPPDDPPALGRHTRAALEAGVAVGFQGAAAELVRRVAAEAGASAAPLLLTGGAARYLRRPGLFAPRAPREVPDLVHVGLCAAAAPAPDLRFEVAS